MKSIFKNISLMLGMVMAMGFTSCSVDNDPFITAAEDDYPRILQPWFGEWENGEPTVYKSIPRNINFLDSVTVTPADYTTVEWFLNDELVNTGTRIDMPLIADEYTLKIVATTTQGKSTSRTGKLVVTALDGDPTIDADSKTRHMMPGEAKSVSGTGLEDVTKVYLGKTECTGVSYEGGKLCFTIPQMTEGSYTIIVEKADGTQYGCGKANVTNEPYVEPGEKTLYTGDGTVPNWDTSVSIADNLIGNLEVGQKLRVYFSIVDADYHAIRIITNDWQYDYLAQVDDIQNIAEGYIDLDVTQELIDHLSSGFAITGFGFTVDKVTTLAPSEQTIWSGSQPANWDASLDLANELAGITAGKKVKVYFEITEADYHAMRVTNGDWTFDFLPQVDDIQNIAEGYLEINFTQEMVDKVSTGFLVTGFGYNAVKVTVE